MTHEYAFTADAPASLLFEVDQALGLMARQDLVDEVASTTDLRLSGAGAPPCPGGTRS